MTYAAKYNYGCHPSVHHVGDHHYFLPHLTPPTEPVFSHRTHCSPPYDQGQTGSCTGQSTAKVLELRRVLEGHSPLKAHPSQFFLYANARLKEGSLTEDSGATIRDVAIAATEDGFCDNIVWSSDVMSNLLVKPSDAAYLAAKPEAGLKWTWIEQHGAALIPALKIAIRNGDPVLFGIKVYESFESNAVAKTGKIPVPHYWEQLLGGHAIAMIGWNDKIQCFEFANSWGSTWGDKGYGWLPYAYVTNTRLASDFGAIQDVL